MTVRGRSRTRPLVEHHNVPAGVAVRYEFYMRKAAEAGEKAEATVDPFLRASWERIAASWRDLAEQTVRTARI